MVWELSPSRPFPSIQKLDGPVATIYLKQDGFYAHLFIPIRMYGLKTASSLLKGRSRGETHVTLIQEMVSERSHFVQSG